MSAGHSFLSLTRQAGGTPLRGDVMIAGHEGKIDINSWTWDVAVQSDQAHPSQAKLSKVPCPATTVMMQAMTDGALFDTALIEIYRDETLKGNSDDEIALMLRRVRLVNCELKVSDAEKAITMEEEWTLDYDTVELRFGADGIFVALENFGPPRQPDDPKKDKKDGKPIAGDPLGRSAFLQGSGLVNPPGRR